jgi:nitrite reductase (cytochrome c-552)
VSPDFVATLRRCWSHPGRRWRLPLALAGVLLAAAVLLRRASALASADAEVQIGDSTTDPAEWGRRYPLEFRAWRGGGLEPRRSSAGGTAHSADEDPRLARMWAGWPFAAESQLTRGHAHSLAATDSLTQAPPSACLTCHASSYPELRRAGGGDLRRGADALARTAYEDARRLVRHPVACLDCHEPASMRLRVTRPAFVEGLRQARAAVGERGYDVNRDATPQEMRTFVCAQCHAEYYLAGREEQAALPWARGLKADSILSFYDSTAHVDWLHPVSLAPVLRAQHPTYELFAQGAHAEAGVTCSDCHMPTRRVRGRDVADHGGGDPLADVEHACRGCHAASAKTLQDRAAAIQTSTLELRTTALDALLSLIADIEVARTLDSTRTTLRAARDFQRRAQFLLDFVESERSLGFHAPQESARLLANSINYSRLGQTVIRGDGRVPVIDGLPLRPRRKVEVKGGSGLKQASHVEQVMGGG